MIEVNGETYLTASGAARYLGITRCMFYNNVKARIQVYEFKPRRRSLYKRSELEPFRIVQIAS